VKCSEVVCELKYSRRGTRIGKTQGFNSSKDFLKKVVKRRQTRRPTYITSRIESMMSGFIKTEI